jgi:hypothetical protein
MRSRSSIRPLSSPPTKPSAGTVGWPNWKLQLDDAGLAVRGGRIEAAGIVARQARAVGSREGHAAIDGRDPILKSTSC